MLKVNFWLKKLIKEWIFFSSLLALIVSSVYLKRLPVYDSNDFYVIFELFLLFAVLKSIEHAGLFEYVSGLISGKFLKTKLVVLAAFLSMFITNDVALLCSVPITIISNVSYKSTIVILQAVAVNALSSLVPTGNPQNMFIYLFYNLHIKDFVLTILPFSVISFIVVVFIAIALDLKKQDIANTKADKPSKGLWINTLMLFLVILIVLRIVPIYFGFFIVLYILLFNRKALIIDYILLATFFVFFGLTDNLKQIIHFGLSSKHSVFIISSLLSQIMSNVPAALFLSDFTSNWRQLLWGVSVGGFGSLIGSLANLISYRLYVTQIGYSKAFLLKFFIINYAFFILGIALYFLI